MDELLGIDEQAGYQRRLAALKRARLALWDVFQCCQRTGSADAAIKKDSEVPNNIVGLLASHASIRFVWFNGRKAEEGFRRHIAPHLKAGNKMPRLVALPSTSPAHAHMSYKEKCRRWCAAMRQAGV